MIPIYVDREQISKALALDDEVAKKVLARYREMYRDEGRKLLDRFTIPTVYLVQRLAADTNTSEDYLLDQFKQLGKELTA